MAVKSIWVLCLLSLGFCGVADQEKLVSLELSCGAGPIHMVLDPGQSLLLDCHPRAIDTPLNVTWLHDGAPVLDSEAAWALPNGSLVVHPSSREASEGRIFRDLEGGYSCISSSPYGTLASDTITLQLSSLSSFLLHPEPQEVPAGGIARFECHADGLPMPSITWERDQVPMPNHPRYISLPSGVLQILGVRREDVGSYRCVASNTAHKLFSQDAMLTISSGPAPTQVVIHVPPRNTTVVSGHPTVMECMAQGHPKPLVSWSRQDGKPISTDAVVLETNLLIPDTRSHHAGIYVCRANKPKTREFVIASAELRVLSPPMILQSPEMVSLSRGNTARLVCNSSGEPAPTLRWLKDGEPVQPNGRVKTPSPGVLLINQLGVADAGYYQCISTNDLGTACATTRLSVIVREGLPSAPRLRSASPQSSTAVLLIWERPEHNSDQIIGFSVHYQQAGAGIVEYQFAVNNDTTDYLVKDLLPHTSYTFYVVAYSPMGASQPSKPVTVAMPEGVPSTAPQLSLLSTTPTEIRVMWLPLSPQHSHGTVTRYRIDYSPLDQDQVSSVEVGGNDTQVTLQGLLPSWPYQLRMAAGTSTGFGLPSDWTLHRTPEQQNLTSVLFAPTELKVRARMYSLHVAWQPPPNSSQISGYKLQYRELEPVPKEDRPAIQPIKLRKRNKHYEITGLVPDHMYEVEVWAYNKHTEGYAAVWKGRTERVPTTGAPAWPYLPPLPPSSVQASANSSTSIWLRWEKPRFSTVRIISYTVRCSPAGLRNASLVSYYTSSAQEILLGALKPFTRYELAVQSNGLEVDGPFSGTVEESTFSDRPSTPPADLQLSALDSSSVLVSWRPPLEPNGIIVEYRILYSGNSSQPDYQWRSVSRDGSITSTEVQGLRSATRYFFKMGACTVVGVGPLSPVKDIHTPSERYELDIPSVTGIIVGVCLGLLCILLCICVSFRNAKRREISGELDSSALPGQYRRGRPTPASAPECRDCHELETLMPSGSQEIGTPLAEVTEKQGLMTPTSVDDSLDLEPRVAWNGSISRNWASRITRYRDTLTEDSPVLGNGSLSPRTQHTLEGLSQTSAVESTKGPHRERVFDSTNGNQVEAEVIVHSELSDPEEGPELRDKGASSLGSRIPSLMDEPLSEPSVDCDPDTQSPEVQLAAQPLPRPTSEVLTNHSGVPESEPERWRQKSLTASATELSNGFCSPEPPATPELREHSTSGDDSLQARSRHLATGKTLAPQLTTGPSPFASIDLAQATSAPHGHMCP
ncbi:immunoglobulin superfamily DCC subclass member 4 isoform X2 [Paramormyrops kingsleyae]|uniref:immunoglobulin superfamily DCC subclass member 4 isoform X2 n=1 Tax=Paramormyrops kingsleyae TaxID=1676925 RepID=UPI000CD66FAB|nr:immunoglobulin superfamily DCC subclass member 4-like isoform X2 [Paramormyrops kingsleyae]